MSGICVCADGSLMSIQGGCSFVLLPDGARCELAVVRPDGSAIYLHPRYKLVKLCHVFALQTEQYAKHYAERQAVALYGPDAVVVAIDVERNHTDLEPAWLLKNTTNVIAWIAVPLVDLVAQKLSGRKDLFVAPSVRRITVHG